MKMENIKRQHYNFLEDVVKFFAHEVGDMDELLVDYTKLAFLDRSIQVENFIFFKVDVSGFFHWAESLTQEITQENFPTLKETFSHVKEIYAEVNLDEDIYYTLNDIFLALFYSKVNQCPVGKHIYDRLPKRFQEKFDEIVCNEESPEMANKRMMEKLGIKDLSETVKEFK